LFAACFIYLFITFTRRRRSDILRSSAVVRRCVLGKDTQCWFPPWSQAVYLLWWSSLTKDMPTEQASVWYDRHRA